MNSKKQFGKALLLVSLLILPGVAIGFYGINGWASGKIPEGVRSEADGNLTYQPRTFQHGIFIGMKQGAQLAAFFTGIASFLGTFAGLAIWFEGSFEEFKRKRDDIDE